MNDLMREEFEKSQKFSGMDFTRAKTHPDFYESPYANGAWDGWQASRESLVIKLPKEDDYVQSSETAMFFLLEDVREAIHAAGVKTK